MNVVSSCAFRLKHAGLLFALTYCTHVSASSITAELHAAWEGPRPAEIGAPQEPGVLAEQAVTGIGLHITIVSGQDLTNVAGRKTGPGSVIEVDDRNNQPVEGASVTVVSPGNGPGLVFRNGSRSFSAVTDSRGRVNTGIATPVNVGNFQLVVTAFYHGDKASAVIGQSNSQLNSETPARHQAQDESSAATPGSAPTPDLPVKKSGGLSTGVKAALIGGAGAVAVGLIFAMSHHGSSAAVAAAPAPTTATIGVGGISVGAPH
jgi:hypothetical protein